MRILFLNFEFPPVGGGGANANAYLFDHFASQTDLQIDCVTSTMGDVDETVNFAPNITLYRLQIGKRDRHFWTQREVFNWLARAHAKTGQLLRGGRYDLCHAFFGFPSGMEAWLRRAHLPYLISLRGTDVPGFNPRFSAQYTLLKPLFRRIWRGAGAVVANSEGLKLLAARFEPDLPIRVIPNGIDAGEFAPAPAATGQKPPEILCVSRLVPRKGVQHLIEAMPAVLQAVPDARLTVVGQGEQADALRRRVTMLGLGEKVRLVGYMPHGELPTLYRQAKVFVQPSFYEGMSNTVLEAMASGLPIVAAGEGGREELFHGNAVAVPYGEPGALAQALSVLLRNDREMEMMGARSREIALKFSWSAVAAEYRSLYELLPWSERC